MNYETEYDDVCPKKLDAKPFPLEWFIMKRLFLTGLYGYIKGGFKTALKEVCNDVNKIKHKYV